MNVIVCGAGDMGRHLAEVLTAQGHGVTLIDVGSEPLRKFEELVDVRSIKGSSAHAAVLREAGVDKCDLLVAATDQDEINLLSGVIAKRMGAGRVITRIHHKAYIDRATLDYAKSLDLDHLISENGCYLCEKKFCLQVFQSQINLFPAAWNLSYLDRVAK